MKLGDVVKINTENVGKDYPFKEIEYIDISSVGAGILKAKKHIMLECAPSRARRIVKKDEILLATVRPNLRSFWYARNPSQNMIASTGFAVLRSGKKMNPRFLYYTVSDQSFTDYLTANAKGAAYPAVDIDTIARAEINLPALPTQQKISSILSAYDDLIENNLRRIKILEEMAQALYREWFVHFRFPGHEKVRLVDSPLGKIPEGWEVKSLLDIAEVTYGYAFKSNGFNVIGEGKPVIRIRDVLAGTTNTYSSEKVDSKYMVMNGDILVGMDGDFHMGFWVGGKAYLVQRVAMFRPINKVSNYHLFMMLEKPIRHFNETITGTTVAHLGDKHIKAIKVILPSQKLLVLAQKLFDPYFDLILGLRVKNQYLCQTRDHLLPKLISGELDVSDLEIAISEEA